MGEITATGNYTIVARGFIAYGDTDQSEGRGGRRELSRWTTAEEAIAAARGQGVQGDSGYVSYFETRLYTNGRVQEFTKPVWTRRRTPEGYYYVGWVTASGSYTESAPAVKDFFSK